MIIGNNIINIIYAMVRSINNIIFSSTEIMENSKSFVNIIFAHLVICRHPYFTDDIATITTTAGTGAE